MDGLKTCPTIIQPGRLRSNEDSSLIFMVFFLPLSLYFFYLAALNRAPRAVIVSGVWDVVGVLGALSGFLLIGGPAILSGLYEQWRISWLLGSFQRLREIRGDWNAWIMLYAAYFVGVITFAAWFILQARNRTSIYNVDPHEFESTLRRALEESGIVWKREGLRTLFLHGAGAELKESFSAGLHTEPTDELSNPDKISAIANTVEESPQPATLRWQPFESMHHVSLSWINVDVRVREEIESRLDELLRFVRPPNNPAASWFFTSGALLLLFSLLTLGAIVALRFLRLAA
jgi:hypothetical protein